MHLDFPPIFASDEQATRVYIACGKLALNWGPVELAIEGFLIFLRHLHKSKDKMPRPFKITVGRVEELIKKEPQHILLAEALAPLLEKAKNLHIIRTDIMQSICQGTNINDEIIFGKSDQKRGVAYTETRYSIAQLETAAEEMRSLRAAFEPVFTALRVMP